jgi:hypothetical protein
VCIAGVAAAREGRPVLRVAPPHRETAPAAAAGGGDDDALGAAIVAALRTSMWSNHAILSSLLSYGGGAHGDAALYRALTSIAGAAMRGAARRPPQ